MGMKQRFTQKTSHPNIANAEINSENKEKNHRTQIANETYTKSVIKNGKQTIGE